MRVPRWVDPQTRNRIPRTLGRTFAAAALLTMMGACETFEWANDDSDVPFPRSDHDLLPPQDVDRVAVSRFPTPVDEQPIEFNHSIHAGAVEDGGMAMDCQYCHYVARESIHAGVPASQVCQGCHQMIDTTGRPELVKIKEYWDAGEPIPWMKVHDLPDFVHFNHSAHVGAGVVCQECHGEMEKETVAVKPVQESFLEPGMMEMGWCLNCHKNHPSVEENHGTDASLRRAELKDCYTCHK